MGIHYKKNFIKESLTLFTVLYMMDQLTNSSILKEIIFLFQKEERAGQVRLIPFLSKRGRHLRPTSHKRFENITLRYDTVGCL